jgi:hypothetical protein
MGIFGLPLKQAKLRLTGHHRGVRYSFWRQLRFKARPCAFHHAVYPNASRAFDGRTGVRLSCCQRQKEQH